MTTKITDDAFNEIFKIKKDNVINNLMKIPIKDKGSDRDYIDNHIMKNTTHQGDILYLPEDETGYKYALVVVDIGSRLMDARPLKTLEASETRSAFQAIYNSKKYLEFPEFSIELDKGFDNDIMKQYFKNIGIKYGKTGRHKQQGLVESRNYMIGRIIHEKLNSEEIYNKQHGAKNLYAKNWVEFLPDIIKELNKRLYKPFKEPKKDSDIKFNKKVNGKILHVLRIGTPVRVILEEPRDTADKKLNGKFRASDYRWEDKIRKITNLIIRPNHPIRYVIEGIKNATYTKNELQVYNNESEITQSIVEKYAIEKLIKKVKKNKKIFYEVKWLGFSSKFNTLEASEEIPKELRDEFNKS
jgi:hypothetical protein